MSVCRAVAGFRLAEGFSGFAWKLERFGVEFDDSVRIGFWGCGYLSAP